MRELIRRSWSPRRLVVLLLALFATPAVAYVGPGLGLGAIAVILGIVLSVLVAVLAIVWYPIKRRLASRSNATEPDGG